MTKKLHKYILSGLSVAAMLANFANARTSCVDGKNKIDYESADEHSQRLLSYFTSEAPKEESGLTEALKETKDLLYTSLEYDFYDTAVDADGFISQEDFESIATNCKLMGIIIAHRYRLKSDSAIQNRIKKKIFSGFASDFTDKNKTTYYDYKKRTSTADSKMHDGIMDHIHILDLLGGHTINSLKAVMPAEVDTSLSYDNNKEFSDVVNLFGEFAIEGAEIALGLKKEDKNIDLGLTDNGNSDAEQAKTNNLAQSSDDSTPAEQTKDTDGKKDTDTVNKDTTTSTEEAKQDQSSNKDAKEESSTTVNLPTNTNNALEKPEDNGKDDKKGTDLTSGSDGEAKKKSEKENSTQGEKNTNNKEG